MFSSNVVLDESILSSLRASLSGRLFLGVTILSLQLVFLPPLGTSPMRPMVELLVPSLILHEKGVAHYLDHERCTVGAFA